MKHTVELEWEQVDALVIKELKEVYNNFTPESRPSCGIFSTDLKTDLKEMKKMREGLKRVLNYWGEQVE
jgi:hypothetical protein